jgi:putative transposase
MVERPEDYFWSSYRSRAGIEPRPWLDADPAIEALASTRKRAASIYAALSGSPHSDEDLDLIRGALHRNQLTGDEQFAKTLQGQTGVLVINRARGRPRKTEPETKQAPFGACLWGK